MKKIILFLFAFIFVFTASAFLATKVHAAVTFPNGCSSAIGYSITSGLPCNGTSSATMAIIGCASPIGYSITSGIPCSGASEAIPYLAGCTSTYGYSTMTSAPCNGTNVATTIYANPNTTPGFPTTGTGGPTLAIALLLLLTVGLIIISGMAYAARQKNAA